MPPDPETNLNRGKWIRGSSASAQAAVHDAKQQVKSSSGNREWTTNRSRSNQPDHDIAQGGELVNPAKDELDTVGERAGSPITLGRKLRKKDVDSSSSLGITASQAPVGTPIAAPATLVGIGKASRERGDADATNTQSSKEQSLRRKIVELEDALQQATSSAMNLDHHYRKLWDRANAQSEELQRCQHQVHRLLDDNRSLAHELEAVKAKPTDAKTLPKVRGKELKVDNTDVDQTANEEIWDMPEESDILLTAAAIQMVDVLNVEVRRVAAVLGKALQKTKYEEGHRQIMEITEKARLMLGENMVALLSAELPERARVGPLFVQVVLQVAITNWCKTTICSWKPGNSEVSNLLGELYSKIREVGKSASTFKTDPPLRQK
jgi:hypothetical protein